MATINILPEGFMFDDRYKVIRFIGQGGMGIVYLAQDTKLNNEHRAIKTIRPELLSNRKNAAQLKNEALAAMKLAHKNIVKVYNYEESQGVAYLVMEYVDGPPLTQYLVDQKKLTIEQFMEFASQICQALQFAHDENILHQDIKPDNIFVNSENVAKLADFGIARSLADAATRLTGAVPSGTVAYMSPELINGGKPEIKSDLYMLGISFYEMLKGDTPFVRGDIFRQHMEKTPQSIDGIPAHINSTILKALAKNPYERPGSADEFFRMLQGAKQTTDSGKISNVSKSVKPTVIDKRRYKVPPPKKTSSSINEEAKATLSYKLAIEALHEGEYEEAQKLFRQTIEQDRALKDIIDPKIIECKALLSQRERQKELNKKRKEELERVPVYLITAKEYLEKGEIHDAYSFYLKILNVDPENQEAQQRAGELKKDIYLAAKKEAAKNKRRPIKNWVLPFVLAVIIIILIIAVQMQPKTQNNNADSAFEVAALHRQNSIIMRIEENMVQIPKGELTAKNAEGEDYTLSLETDIFVNRFEVTQQEFVAVMGANSNKSPQKGANLPVVNVSWYEAKDFCDRLCRITGAKYRLLNSAEWEYASRADSSANFFWGDDENLASKYAWFEENSDNKIQQVGQKGQNKWRLHDVCGNVWEWCNDAVETNRKRRKTGESYRTIRGGSIASNVEAFRGSVFAEQVKAAKSVDIGFRIARESEGSQKPKEIALSQQDSNKATRLLKEKESSVIPQVSNDNINKIKSMFKLVRIPAGSFTMGSRDGYPDEIPPHQVSISRPFWINKYEVTQEQYELVMGNNPSNFKSPQRPVEMVSWEDTVAFCKKVSELTGEKYRLPTEAEWEYACRGGSDTNYYWGSDRSQMPKHAWYGENSKIMTHDVGKKKPNNWGLYDMNGNVSEWCLDFYDKFYYSHGHAHDPLNEKGETFRVHRGGSWTSIRTMITSSERDSNTEYYHYYNLGFRVVKEIPRSSIPGKDDKILNSVTPD